MDMELSHAVIFPEETRLRDVAKSLFTLHKTPDSICSPEQEESIGTWQNTVSSLFAVFLENNTVVYGLQTLGSYLEGFINLHRVNGGLTGTAWKLMTFQWKRIKTSSKELQPLERWSVVKMLDPREDLINPNVFKNKDVDPGTKEVADVCMMASKLVYESPDIIKDTIGRSWQMQVESMDVYPNSYRKGVQTQAVVFTSRDNKKQVKAIVVAFRGTQFFESKQWSMDFDFSFVELLKGGSVHAGFLEALGFIIRDKDKHIIFEKEGSKLKQIENSAFEELKRVVNGLLEMNKDAKVYITGHSLGGALAVLFCMMMLSEDETFRTKLGAVYTFGQPRAGNEDSACYTGKLLKQRGPNGYVSRYFRVVYSNDLVPRVPFDDFNFRFKHLGFSFFFNSFYLQQTRLDEPNKNFFTLAAVVEARVMAVFKILQALVILPLIYGRAYQETWTSIGCRFFGLLVPGLADHSPVNYVNSVRLGPALLTQRSSFERLFDKIKELIKDLGSNK